MMIRCHMIEDEPMASKLLQLHVSKLPFLRLVAVSDNPIHALESLKTNPVDLLFLDIRMPEMSGLDLLEALPDRPLVILTTAFSEFAVRSYDFDVVDYLQKPITFERFARAVGKAARRFVGTGSGPGPDSGSGLRSGFSKEKPAGPDYIFVKEGTRFVKIEIGDILFFEGLKNYVTIHTTTLKIVSLQRLKTLEALLPSDKFIRVHNSFIVAKAAVASVKDNEIQIGSARIPIGETYFKSFMDFIDGRRQF
jgi:two-component system LytT family response regulator